MTSQKHVQIWHNPRCSKSRQTLSLLQEQSIEPEIIEYLKQPPSVATLENTIHLLGITARELIRNSEPEYETLALADPNLSEEALIKAMSENPKLIQRPIVIRDGKHARIGRPPVSVLEILND